MKLEGVSAQTQKIVLEGIILPELKKLVKRSSSPVDDFFLAVATAAINSYIESITPPATQDDLPEKNKKKP